MHLKQALKTDSIERQIKVMTTVGAMDRAHKRALSFKKRKGNENLGGVKKDWDCLERVGRNSFEI